MRMPASRETMQGQGAAGRRVQQDGCWLSGVHGRSLAGQAMLAALVLVGLCWKRILLGHKEVLA